MHRDLTDLLTHVNGEVIQLGQQRGVEEAVAYLDSVRLAEPRTKEWLRGFDEGRGAVAHAGPYYEGYLEREGKDPDDLNFDPTNLLAVLAEIEQEGVDLGRWDAIEAGRAQRDTEAGNPDPANYYDEDDPDEDEVQEYQDRVDYVAGLEFVPVCLVEHFEINHDPTWEPCVE